MYIDINTPFLTIPTNILVEDNLLIAVDSKMCKEAGIKQAVYISANVWNRYIQDASQPKVVSTEARVWNILSLFALTAQYIKAPEIEFTVACEVRNELYPIANETGWDTSDSHRNVTLKATMYTKDIDELSAAIFILLPGEV